MSRYKIDGQKIQVLYPAANKTYQPADQEVKEKIKEQYTEGKEYFLFSGAVHPRNNLMNLLKAFSFFKKRQKSNMQLVIVSPVILPDDVFMKSLRLYKYRREVKVLTGLPEDELQKLFAAAYAYVRPAIVENNFTAILNAMQCGVPAICGNSKVAMETCGDAALYSNPDNFEDIAEKMMLLFKDENKRNGLIQKGLLQSAKYNSGEMMAQLWKIIFATIQPL